VDATPLFIVLAGAYYDRTADLAFIRSIWPHVELALQWINDCGDRDHDGFVEYSRQTDKGLVQQGWKDSNDGFPCRRIGRRATDILEKVKRARRSLNKRQSV